MNTILDASVLVNLLIGESNKQTKAIAAIKRKGLKCISSFTFIEVLNSLRYELKDLQLVLNSIEKLNSLELKVLEVDQNILTAALKISLKVNDTIYDASYHALALIYDLTFVTFDERYYRKAKALGNIQLL
mgnify:CR=1 FL=1